MLELTESLNSFQHRSPKLYLGFVVFIAMIGVSILALLPILSINFFIATLITLYTTIISQIQALTELANILYQAPLAALFAYLSYQFITLQLDTPKASEIYVTINKKKAPKLISLIEEMEQHFNIDKINNIIITDQYDISVHITPYYGIPKLGETSLQIGLPLMQTISAKQFKALLARRIGQLSFKTQRVTNKIYFFRDQVSQYLNACQNTTHW